VNELELVATARQRDIAELVGSDPYYPGYHFISPTPRNVCFDPNGAIYWKGRYHLFYIYQDAGYRTEGDFSHFGHCWGHASSTDLVHWTYHPTALAPEPVDPETAIFSGCALLNRQGVPVIVYHGVGAGTCIATAADDELIVWNKSQHNPVITEPTKEGDTGWGIYNVFDPHVWLQGDTYYAMLGGMVKPEDKHDTAYLFRSPNLIDWEYLHPLYTPSHEWTTDGDDCACPKFFRLGDQQVLLCISHATGARYYLGQYENDVFVPTAHQTMNWPGGCCFAPETLVDDRGRRIMWAWAVDQRKDDGIRNNPGVMTLPRVLSMAADSTLRIVPAPELEVLRQNHRAIDNIVLQADTEFQLGGINGNSLELAIEAVVAPDGRFGVKVCAAPDDSEHTIILFDSAAGELVIDFAQSSLSDTGWRPVPMDSWRGIPCENVSEQRAPFTVPEDEKLRLRVFIDRSILEVFVNERHCLTQRIYPTLAESTGVSLLAEGAGVHVESVQAWDMEAVNG